MKLIFATCLTLLVGYATGPSLQTLRAADKTAVRTVAVAMQTVERTTVQPATVHAYYMAEMEARLAGYVSVVKAEIGDVVSKGAVLATISVPEMAKKREVMRALVLRAEANETQASSGIQLAKADVQSAAAKQAQAESQLASVKASLAAMESEFNRTAELVQRQSVQPRMLDEARKKRDSERANIQSVGSSIEAAKADVIVARAKLSAAEADLAAANAETTVASKRAEEFEELLKYSQIVAPFDGVVTHRDIDPGDLVRETTGKDSSHPLFVVSQVNKVRVQIPIPEADAAFIRKGDSVELSFPSFPGEKAIAAKITRSSGSLDPSTRTMLVEAELSNAEGKLIPGMFGQAKVTVAATATAQVLPARAVRFDEAGKAYVYAVDANETVSIVPVTTGRDNGHIIEVTSGLVTGQRVIAAHLKRFTDGESVRVIQ